MHLSRMGVIKIRTDAQASVRSWPSSAGASLLDIPVVGQRGRSRIPYPTTGDLSAEGRGTLCADQTHLFFVHLRRQDAHLSVSDCGSEILRIPGVMEFHAARQPLSRREKFSLEQTLKPK